MRGDVVGQRDRAAQRDLRRRVAADDRVPMLKKVMSRVGVQLDLRRDAALREVRRELAVRQRELAIAARQRGEIGLAVEERQPARLVFLDDGDLDAVDQRQPAPALAPRDRLPFGSSAAGAVEQATSRYVGVRSSTMRELRRHASSRYGPVPTGCAPMSSP